MHILIKILALAFLVALINAENEQQQCNNSVHCFNHIHLSYIECVKTIKEDNEIYGCIDTFLLKMPECKPCICDVVPEMHFCQNQKKIQQQQQPDQNIEETKKRNVEL